MPKQQWSGGTVRVGAVHYNAIAEIDQLLNALDDMLPRANVARQIMVAGRHGPDH